MDSIRSTSPGKKPAETSTARQGNTELPAAFGLLTQEVIGQPQKCLGDGESTESSGLPSQLARYRIRIALAARPDQPTSTFLDKIRKADTRFTGLQPPIQDDGYSKDVCEFKPILSGFLEGRLDADTFCQNLPAFKPKRFNSKIYEPGLYDLLAQYYCQYINPAKVEFHYWLDTALCDLVPALIALTYPELTTSAINTAPIASDAPINLIWVGQLLPEVYRLEAVRAANANPGRDVVLWYYSGNLTEKEVQCMNSLAESKEYQEASIKVLDLAKLDEESLLPSFRESTEHKPSLSKVLEALLPKGEPVNKKNCLIAADYTRYFLMAAGSEAIDQLSPGSQPRESTGMLYMDLDALKSMFVVELSESPIETMEKRPLSQVPLMDLINHTLPAGLCTFYHYSFNKVGLDHGFLGTNHRENPIFLQTLIKAEEGITQHKQLLETLGSEASSTLVIPPEAFVWYPFLSCLENVMKPFGVTYFDVFEKDEVILSFAAFNGYVSPELAEHAVSRGGVTANVDLLPIGSSH